MPGYADPPKEHMFTSENQPKNSGRKKGSKSLKTVLRDLLAAQDPDGEWANPISQKLLQKAFNDNDLKAIQEIIDRIEGKASQNVNIGGQENNPLSMNVTNFVIEEKIQEIKSESLPGPNEDTVA